MCEPWHSGAEAEWGNKAGKNLTPNPTLSQALTLKLNTGQTKFVKGTMDDVKPLTFKTHHCPW